MIVIVRYFISDIIFDDYFNTISFNSGKMRKKKKERKSRSKLISSRLRGKCK